MDNGSLDKPVKTSLWRRLGLLLLLLIALLGVVYTLGGFILLPRLARDALVNYVQESVARELRVHDIEFNPFTFAASLNGVELREGDGTLLLSLQSLSAELQIRDLIEGNLILNDVGLQDPWVHLQIDRDGNLNLARLVEDVGAGETEQQNATGEKSALPFLVKHFQLHNGVFKVTDLTGSKPASAYLAPINLEVNELSNRPEAKAHVNLTAVTSGGGSLHWKGALSLQPLASRGQMKLDGIRLLTAWEFLQDELNIEPPQGSIDLETNYSFSQSQTGPTLVVDNIGIQLSNLMLKLKGAANPLAKVAIISMTDAEFDLDGSQLSIGELRVADGALNVSREKRLFDWEKVISKRVDEVPTKVAQENAVKAGPDWKAEIKRLTVENVGLAFVDGDLSRPVVSRAGSAGLSFKAQAQQSNGRLDATLSEIELQLMDYSMRHQSAPVALLELKQVELHQGRLDLLSQTVAIGRIEINEGATRVVREKNGQLEWQSVWKLKRADIQKIETQLQKSEKPWLITAPSVLLKKFNIALSDRTNETAAELNLTPVDLELTGISSALDKPIGVDLAIAVKQGGKLTVKGEVNAAMPSAVLDIDVKALSLLPLRPYLQPVANIKLGSGYLSTRGQLNYATDQQDSLTYNGYVRIDKLLITEPNTDETLLGWKLFDAAELALSLKPDSLHVKEILLSEPAGKFVVNKDFSTNWQQIVKSEQKAETAGSSKAATAAFPISVERLQLDAGKLDFADLSLPLPFSSKIHELSGAIVGISTKPGAKANSDLKGRVDEFGSATIKGEIALFDPLLFTDMGVAFSNLNMVNLTPYTAKFAGYEIDSGKLSLDLHYKINGKKLQGNNQIILNKLKLGEKVESPDAIDAPLELAIALMQDSKGVIDLGLPIQGDLDDPEFSYGHLVFKAIGNIITKIVTAPFSILGALLGVQGDNLDSVVFEPGSAILAPPEQEKLRSVAKLLGERPKLALEIQGVYDEKSDGEALRERAVRASIGKRLGRKSVPGKAPDPISLTDEKTRTAVEALFTKRFSAAELARLKKPVKSRKVVAGSRGDANPADTEKGAGRNPVRSQPEDLYQKLYRRLVEKQPIGATVLKKLAQARGQAIVREAKNAGKLPDARIRLLEPTSVTLSEAGKVISKLNLGVGK